MWHFHTVICYWRQTELVCCDCWCFLHDTLKTHDEWVSEWVRSINHILDHTCFWKQHSSFLTVLHPHTARKRSCSSCEPSLCHHKPFSFFFFIYTMTALIKFSLSLNRQWYGRTCQWVRHCFRRSSWDNWETQAPLLL